MGLFYQQDINGDTRFAVWKIEESEDFFLRSVDLHRAISHPHKRLQHLAGRYLLRHLFPDFPEDSILIADTRKPYLRGEPYHFSISHCGDYAAAIVSTRQRVGIDIEEFNPKVLHILHKFLGDGERAFLDPENRIRHAIVCWGAKEAVYKWYGVGEMDFIRDIPLDAFPFRPSGAVCCRFATGPLTLHYQVSAGWALVYLATG